MAKLKKISKYKKFWERFADYAQRIAPDGLYIFATTIVSTYAFVFNNRNRQYMEKKFKDKIEFVKTTTDNSEYYLEFILARYLFEIISDYLQTGEWHDVKNILSWAYDTLMSDFHRMNYNVEELLSHKEEKYTNIANGMPENTWLLVYGIVNEDIRPCMVVYNRENRLEETTKRINELSSGIKAFKTDSVLQQEIQEFIDENFKSQEDLLVQYEAEKLNDGRIAIPEDVYKAFVYTFETTVEKYRRYLFYKEYAEKIENRIEELSNYYREIISLQRQKIDQLKEEMALTNGIKRETIYIDNADKYENLINELQLELMLKNEEIEFLKSQLGKLEEQQISNVELEPFAKPVYINYFGLKNDALEARLLQYNVFVNYHSPTNPNQDLGNDNPVVFNISVASHSVFEKIKDKKPLIVTGTNADILSKKIVEWLSER